jgi:hypothetical protein
LASATAASGAIAALAEHAPALAPLLNSLGVLLLSVAGAAFLVAAIPAALAMARAAVNAAALLRVLERELPDTLATMRLSGLELSDCIAEMGSLQSELAAGVKASARMVSATEQGIKAGAAFVDSAVGARLKGALAGTEAAARGGRRRAPGWGRCAAGVGGWGRGGEGAAGVLGCAAVPAHAAARI